MAPGSRWRLRDPAARPAKAKATPHALPSASIELRDVSFGFGDRLILRNITLQASGRQRVGIVGPNGTGKTTLLGLINGELQPQCGSVCLGDRPLATMSRQQVARQLAHVAQVDPDQEIPFTVARTVLQGRLPYLGPFEEFSATDREIAYAALRRAGAVELAERRWSELSGGEQRRVLIARALCQQTPILLLDEPTNHLDLRYQHQVMSLAATLDALVIVVLHDLNLAARYCDRIIVLDRGGIAADGLPDEVLTPDVLEPVYGVRVSVHRLDGVRQLLFTPEGTHV